MADQSVNDLELAGDLAGDLLGHLRYLEHLGYRNAPGKTFASLGPREYAVMVHQDGGCEVTLGAGRGYSGFCCSFDFDAAGRFRGHRCFE
jgi:hypothetical protein